MRGNHLPKVYILRHQMINYLLFIFFLHEECSLCFTESDDITTAGSLQFDFKAIEAATNKFCETNKLGQGGFGEVYKVLLPLSKTGPNF